MKLWVVSGARRGVGKTRLSRELARLLPSAVYAKVGHNPRRPAGPENYFTSVEAFLAFRRHWAGHLYCVVESNRPEVRSLADLRVFISAPVGTTDIRPDAEELHGQADIRIARNERPEAWEAIVAAKVEDPDVARRVCEAFDRQRRFIVHGRRSPSASELLGSKEQDS